MIYFVEYALITSIFTVRHKQYCCHRITVKNEIKTKLHLYLDVTSQRGPISRHTAPFCCGGELLAISPELGHPVVQTRSTAHKVDDHAVV